jgi:predicted O-methyltransferase YrrM
MNLQEIIQRELATLDNECFHGYRKEKSIVETGTIRGDGEQHRVGDGWSTVALAEHVRDNGGMVTSIDLDVSTARKVLTKFNLDEYVTLVEGHSIQMLTRLAVAGERFDVVLLDSENDAQLILDEYLVVSTMLNYPGLLIVDDVDLVSELVLKGHKLVPWLDREGTSYEIVQRDCDGYTAGVLIARFGWV